MPRPFIFVLHNHQPVGNFEHVFEDAYERCYRPVTELIERYEPMKVGLHFSGPLLEWLKTHRPDYLKRTRALVERGQVEILGGGFYEPILSVLPDNDATGQLEMMAMFCERHFGKRPKGMWLAERVWDPDLPRILAQAGIAYTLLDDSHFRAAGVPEDRIAGHYVTEKAGHAMSILPIDKGLRYRIPFAQPHEVVDYLAMHQEGPCLTYGDDGEKFGLWPDTYEWVFEKKWLENFFRAVCEAQEQGRVRSVLPSEHLASSSPMGRVYLPNASYEEMMEWALPVDGMRKLHDFRERLKNSGEYETFGPFVRGAMWQSFLAKYPEANQIHKKMLHVSNRLQSAMDDAMSSSGSDSISGDAGDLLGTAQRELYRGQCCCAYWHGLFGGLYLNYLRHALYESLLKAEAILDRMQQGDEDWLSYEQQDVDLDGREEVVLSNRLLNVYVHPHEGAAVFELDYKPKHFNLTNVLTRREEGYHQHAKGQVNDHGGDGGPKTIHDIVRVKEEGLDRYLVYDDVPRWTFVDRFYPEDLTLEGVKTRTIGDLGDFAAGDYQVVAVGVDERETPVAKLEVERHGRVKDLPVHVKKSYQLSIEGSDLLVEYRITNESDQPTTVCFGTELNLSLLAGNDPSRYLVIDGGAEHHPMESEGVTDAFFEAMMVDEWSKFRLVVGAAGGKARLLRHPIETVSQSESGLERTYQGTCLLPVWRLELKPKETETLNLRLGIKEVGEPA